VVVVVVVVVVVKTTVNQLVLTLVFSTANMFIPQKYGPAKTHADYVWNWTLSIQRVVVVIIIIIIIIVISSSSRWHYTPVLTSASLMDFSQSALLFDLSFYFWILHLQYSVYSLCVLRLHCKLALCGCSVYSSQTQQRHATVTSRCLIARIVTVDLSGFTWMKFN